MVSKLHITDGNPNGPDLSNEATVIVDRMFRARGLLDYFEDAFRELHVRLEPIDVKHLTISLRDKPEPEPLIDSNNSVLAVQVGCGISRIVAVPCENSRLGEFFIDLVEEALEKLNGFVELPAELFRNVLSKYRENNYTYHFKLGERMLPGTKVKGRIDVALACDGLRRKLTLSYRGKELSTHDLIGEDQIPVHFYRFFSRFHMDGNVLTVDRASPTGEDTHIDLADFPDVMKFVEKTRTT